MLLKGPTAIMTGGPSGSGPATPVCLAEEGAAVVQLLFRQGTRRCHGSRAFSIPASLSIHVQPDAGDERQVVAMIERAEAELGPGRPRQRCQHQEAVIDLRVQPEHSSDSR